MPHDIPQVTPELLVDCLSPSRPAVSPDGRWVAYVVGPIVVKGPPYSTLWVAAADGEGGPRPLTDGTHRVAAPRWTPDSAALDLLADGRLTRLTLDGRERPLTAWDGAISDHLPLVGGELTALIAQGGAGDASGDVGDAGDAEGAGGAGGAFGGAGDAEGAGDLADSGDAGSDVVLVGTEPGDGLWLLTPGDPAPRRVKALGDRHVVAIGQRPDGRALAVISWDVPDDEPGALTARLHVVDLAADTAQDLGRAALDAGSPVWWREGDAWHVSYLGLTPHAMSGGAAVLDVTVPAAGDADGADAATPLWGNVVGGAHRDLTAGFDSCPTELTQTADGGPLALFAAGLDTTVQRLDPATGRFAFLTLLGGAARALTADDSGQVLAMLRSTAYVPNDVHSCRVGGPFHRLSDTRPRFRDIAWGTQERLAWTAADGLALDGILVLPPGRGRGDGPLPLLTMVHGGPYDRYADDFQYANYLGAQWFAAAGYAVLLPNPRGSMGRGHAFAALVAAAVGGDELTDILAAVDHLVADGTADPDRLAIGGWSHGGFMAAWAITRTDRFKAAIMGAGISDWGMQVAFGDYGTIEAGLSGSTGWEGAGPHPHDAVSPISHVSDVRTPVLILHGADDTNVPLAQATYFHRALTHHGVPHEFAVYPGEGHGFRSRAHQIDVLRRTRGFLARYV